MEVQTKTLMGKVAVHTVPEEGATVGDVRASVLKQEGFPADRPDLVNLLFQGTTLTDDMLLHDRKIGKSSSINLVVSMRKVAEWEKEKAAAETKADATAASAT